MGCAHSVSPDVVNLGSATTKITAVAPEPATADNTLVGHESDTSGLCFRDAVKIRTNLISACKKGDLEEVEDLLKAGESVNTTGMWASTPLLIALQYGHIKIVQRLLDVADIDINHSSEKGATALLLACLDGFTSIVARLILMNCNMDIPVAPSIYNSCIDRNIACTPMSIACVNGHEDVVTELINAGVNKNCQFSFQITKAIRKPSTIMCTNTTPLMIACSFGRLSLVESLLSKQIDAHAVDSDGCTALHHTVRAAKTSAQQLVAIDIIEKLQSIGDLDYIGKLLPAVDCLGDNALLVCCDNNAVEIAKSLLRSGTNANWCSTISGVSPLHIAVKRKHVEMVRLLLQHSASPTQEDSTGVSPAMLAASSKAQTRQNSEIMQLLEEAIVAKRAAETITHTMASVVTGDAAHSQSDCDNLNNTKDPSTNDEVSISAMMSNNFTDQQCRSENSKLITDLQDLANIIHNHNIMDNIPSSQENGGNNVEIAILSPLQTDEDDDQCNDNLDETRIEEILKPLVYSSTPTVPQRIAADHSNPWQLDDFDESSPYSRKKDSLLSSSLRASADTNPIPKNFSKPSNHGSTLMTSSSISASATNMSTKLIQIFSTPTSTGLSSSAQESAAGVMLSASLPVRAAASSTSFITPLQNRKRVAVMTLL